MVKLHFRWSGLPRHAQSTVTSYVAYETNRPSLMMKMLCMLSGNSFGWAGFSCESVRPTVLSVRPSPVMNRERQHYLQRSWRRALRGLAGQAQMAGD